MNPKKQIEKRKKFESELRDVLKGEDYKLGTFNFRTKFNL